MHTHTHTYIFFWLGECEFCFSKGGTPQAPLFCILVEMGPGLVSLAYPQRSSSILPRALCVQKQERDELGPLTGLGEVRSVGLFPCLSAASQQPCNETFPSQ